MSFHALRVTAGLAALGGLLLVTVVPVNAGSTQVAPDIQGYSTTGPDPYSDSDLHLGVAGPNTESTSYVHLDLGLIPRGADIVDLQMTLVPNGKGDAQNTNSGSASFWACALDRPMTKPFDSSNPPPSNCGRVHTSGQLQSNGNFKVDLEPLARDWARTGNQGVALVPQPGNGGAVPNPLGAPATTWTISFDHARTTAQVTYSLPASSGGSQPATANSITEQPINVPGNATLITAPLAPAVAPAATNPGAAPSAAPSAVPQGPGYQGRAAPVLTTTPRVQKGWVYVLGAIGAAIVCLLCVGAVQQMSRPGGLAIAAIWPALSSARSQMATPLALLALAAVVSAGYSGQMVTSIAGIGGGGASAAGGDASGAGGPNIATPGASAAPGPSGGGTTATGGGSQPGFASRGGGGSTSGNLPGVTATTVTIGMEHLTDSNQQGNQAIGATLPDNGDVIQQANIMAKWVNAHGGVAGRNVVIRTQDVSNARALSDPNYLTTVCQTFTQDYHVFAVLDWVNSLDAKNCYADNRTLLLDNSPEQISQADFRNLYPYVWAPVSMGGDRAMKTKLQGLQALGYFQSPGPTYKIGVLMPDNPREQAVFRNITVPTLNRFGVPTSNIHQYAFAETGSVQGFLGSEQAAVANAEANGVNHVITEGVFSGGEGGLAVGFMLGAYKQGYHPLYGLGTTDAPGSQEDPLNGSYQVSDDQLPGSVVVSTNEGGDIKDSRGDSWPPATGTEESRCAQIFKDGGVAPFSTRYAAFQAMDLCDSFTFLWKAGQGYTNLNALTFSQHAMQIGAFPSATSYGSTFGAYHMDGPSTYRLEYAQKSCDSEPNKGHVCFQFKSRQTYQAPSIGPGEL